jgi:hypothetical protein
MHGAHQPPLTGLHPCGCGVGRERMDYPWRRATGVADDAVARLQPLEHLPHRCRIDRGQFLQPGNIGGEAIVDEPAHQLMMDRRFKFTLLDHVLLQFPRKKWKCRSDLQPRCGRARMPRGTRKPDYLGGLLSRSGDPETAEFGRAGSSSLDCIDDVLASLRLKLLLSYRLRPNHARGSQQRDNMSTVMSFTGRPI